MLSENPKTSNSLTEFLFERKHWKRILKSIPPSLRLKAERLYTFDEPQAWFAEGDVKFSLGLSESYYYLKKITNEEASEIDEAITNGTILLIRELQVGPKDLTIGGIRVYDDSKPSECIEELPSVHGFVYLIRNQELYKIGITTNLLRRMKQLKPDEALNVVRCKNFKELEKEIHRQFKEFRIPQTEYFRFTLDQVSQVNRMMVKLAEVDDL